ncbi:MULTISPECIES: transcriptional regulator SlyA [Thalassospira]|jgi:MarR family transcriptional regulator for hemolysin|uniref:MarR family transcriptional regulator n=1 Tax=Thalassospira profundimaris TaxID=502049 RepID=A0A367WDF8_9PROT|nr:MULTISPECIES: transcriptional regulator SlyA [Thalassospira]OSQ34754.1 MarR family transcriptional regulator [Thalassospira sp. MCCC 1A01428]RCK39484.1 MarR family transcriptional regulator [Thalassospira profundimaris]
MTKPLDDQEQFGLRLGLVARLWRAEIDRRLATFGLTESRWLTLLHLSRLPQAATQRELAEAVGVRGPTLVRTLDRLEAEGLIERRTETADRRTKSVHLRAEAAPVLERIEATAAAVRAEILSDITSDEVATCLKVLEQIAGKLGGTPRAMRPADEDR